MNSNRRALQRLELVRAANRARRLRELLEISPTVQEAARLRDSPDAKHAREPGTHSMSES